MANGNEAGEPAASVDVDPPVTYALATGSPTTSDPGQYDEVRPGDLRSSPAGSTTDGDTYLDFDPRYALPVDDLSANRR